jgi:2',3'-cyclic-nucleotide 2'-phosphodiesterase (5'-nucleotidase family)
MTSQDPSVEAPKRGPRLRMLCVNDVYTLENLPRLATLAAELRAEDPGAAFVTTLAGDFVSPSLLSSLDGGRGMIDCMNGVPIDYVCFGNHEDDISATELHARIGEFKGVWLSTNVLDFDPRLVTAAVLEIGRPEGGRRVRVGLVGVVMDDAAAYRAPPFGGAKLLPPNDVAVCAANHLYDEERCALVVPLTHQPIDQDRALAGSEAPPFPVIVGGHEHVVEIERVGSAWIEKAGADAVHAVLVDLVWPAVAPPAGTRDFPAIDVRMLDVAPRAENAALRARVDKHMAAVAALEAATLMTVPSTTELSSVGSRARQTSLGTLVASLLRDALGADAAIVNGGGLRGSRAYTKRFTYGDLRAEVPFENEAVVAELPGHVLADAVATSRAKAPLESGGFLQVDDAMIVDDEHGHALTHVAGAPLDPARGYRVALVRNLFEGMDHVGPLVAFAKAQPADIPRVGSGREVKLVLLDAFSRALLRKLGPFELIDTNHDGALDPDEIAAAVARVTSEPASKLTVDLLMKACDRDQNARISREEANAATKG